jgi:ribose transport system permease protein
MTSKKNLAGFGFKTYRPGTALGMFWPAYAICLVISIIGVLINPRFISGFNLANLIQQATALLIVALGQTAVVVYGGLDLSVGSTISMTTAIATLIMTATGSIFLGVAGALAAGILVGVLNGYGVAKLSINPFMMTLATMTVVKGVTLAILPTPDGLAPESFASFFTGTTAVFPNALLICIAITGLCWWLMNYTRPGREVYAVGYSKDNAHFCGISVSKTTFTTFIASSIMAVIAGLFITARIRSGDPLVGQNFSLDSVTAVVLGGSVIGGGIGSVLGTVPGVMIIVFIGNILNFAGVPAFIQYIIRGLLLIVTVGVFNSISRRKE